MSTAVIVAAGMGTRFGHHTDLIPKGFIPFKGTPMVLRSIATLRVCGIDRIIIGTGYHREHYEALAERDPGITCVFSPRFAETNSMYTLWNCREAVGGEDFLLLESDIVFEPRAVTALLEDPRPDVMLITPVTKFQDQYYVEMDAAGNLAACSTDPDALHPSGELVGIHKISNAFYRTLCAEYAAIVEQEPKRGYEFELLDVARRRVPMGVLCIPGLQWYEIDDPADLRFAEEHIQIR